MIKSISIFKYIKFQEIYKFYIFIASILSLFYTLKTFLYYKERNIFSNY